MPDEDFQSVSMRSNLVTPLHNGDCGAVGKYHSVMIVTRNWSPYAITRFGRWPSVTNKEIICIVLPILRKKDWAIGNDLAGKTYPISSCNFIHDNDEFLPLRYIQRLHVPPIYRHSRYPSLAFSSNTNSLVGMVASSPLSSLVAQLVGVRRRVCFLLNLPIRLSAQGGVYAGRQWFSPPMGGHSSKSRDEVNWTQLTMVSFRPNFFTISASSFLFALRSAVASW
jgi:hypothetical protein